MRPRKLNDEDATDQLYDCKLEVYRLLDAYISWWKLSLFGHHHDERARSVKDAIKKCHYLEEIKEILENQRDVLKQQITGEVFSSFLGARWTHHLTLKNIPSNSSSSGYYQTIVRALEKVNEFEKTLVSGKSPRLEDIY